MSQDPVVYISILNWNHYKATIKCIETLETLVYDNYQIIVTDNGSTDKSVSAISDRFPNIILLETGENYGYAGGHEFAVNYAINQNADLVWILNNDLEVYSDTLTRLVEAWQDNHNAIYGSLPLNSDTSVLNDDTVVAFPRKYFEFPFRQKLFVVRPFATYGELFPNKKTKVVSSVSGSSILIPVSVIKDYGFMDTSYFLYNEEADYSFRLRQHGVSSYIVPSSVVLHKQGHSSSDNNALKNIVTYYQIRNQILFIKRHNSMIFIVSVIFRNAILMLMFALFRGKSGLQKSGYIVRGLIDGLHNIRGKTLAPEDVV